MPTDIVMPKLGLTMTEGLIIEWKKKEGDQVKKGDVLFILETEKVTYEVEAPEDGILGKILIREQETVPVGAVVAYLLGPGEDMSDLEAMAGKESKPSKRPSEERAEELPVQGVTAPMKAEALGSSHKKASPLAQKTARLYNLDLRDIHGTGPGGMVIKEDVEKIHVDSAKKAPFISPSIGEFSGQKVVPLTGMRRAIAKKMLASKTQTAQTYMSNTVDASHIVEYRKEQLPNIQEQSGVRITITDIMMKITSAAILEHPIVNTRWTDEGIFYYKDVHMGMAMALDEGLIVPVIRDINKKSLEQIAKDRLELIQKGKEKKFLPDDITGSTFTLSAMGMFGLEQFTANINLPENAILAVGAIIEKPVAIDGSIAIRPTMNVTLSYDHRTIDGAEAGKFMCTLKSFIEDPIPVLESYEMSGMADHTRIAIIGSGVGGYPAAITAARLGADVTLIEKGQVGGVCLNWGCIPTKSLLQSCQVIKTIKESEVFGVNCENRQFDLKAIMGRKNSVVEKLRNGVEKLLAAKRIKIIKGRATLVDSKTVQILNTQEEITYDKIIIASGSIPRTIQVDGIEGPGIWYSDDLLVMKKLPKSLAIIGGGVIGVEFAQILNRLGVRVTIIEMMEHLIPGADREVALALEKCLVEEGIKVFSSAVVKKIRHKKKNKTIDLLWKDQSQECIAEKIIISVGRQPDLTWLDLDKIGLAKKHGALLVNDRMETNISGIYAVGDVVGGYMLAHVAMAEGECAAKNAMGQKTAMSYDATPSCIYTFPEVAWVGLSEERARREFDIQVGRFSFHGSGKALVINETYGMVKIVSEKRSGEVLGVHIIGPHATDLIGEAVLGISKNITIEELAHAVHPHPSLSEAIMESALSLCGGAIHMP